jgi:Tfp pilus assembly protein PilV
MKNNLSHNKKGFTLVETMVAISVLMFAILGPLSIASSSLANARTARDQVTAYYLAQEGLEFIRYTRDTNFLSNPDNAFSQNPDEDNWLIGIDNCMDGNICQIDVAGYFASNSTQDPADYIQECTGALCDTPLSIDSETGLYTYDTSDNRYSPFIRTVAVERVENNPRGISTDNSEIKVTAVVKWKPGAGLIEKTVTLTEYVSNIYDYE